MTPIYSNGTWGRVIAVVVDGVRINRPIEGATKVESVQVEIGEVEIPCPVDEYEPTTMQVTHKVVADAGTHTIQHEGYDDLEIVLGDREFSHTQEVEIVSPVPTSPITIDLGRKTFTRTVPDVDPRWAELEFADGFLDDLPEPEPEPVQVTQISRRQGRLLLHNMGLLTTVETAVAAAGIVAQIFYESETWLRGDAFVNSLGPQLGLTSEQLDEMFNQAALL